MMRVSSLGLYWFVLLLMVAGIMATNVHAAPSTNQNEKTRHIQFNFDNEASLKIAPLGTVAGGESCANVGGQTKKGAIRYNSKIDEIEFCDGTIWKRAGLPASTACSEKTVGITRFNDTKSLMEYCNGTGWVVMGTVKNTTDCDSSLEGKTRFNTSTDILEYCDGSAWASVVKSMKVVVDYPNCTRATTNIPADYYVDMGAPSNYGSMYHGCPKDYYAVATDGDVVKEDGYQMNYIYCCPLKIE